MNGPIQEVKTSGTVGPRRRHVERLVRSGQRVGLLHVSYYPNPPEASENPVARGLPSTSPLYRLPNYTIYLAWTRIDATAMSCYTSLSTLVD